MRIEHVAIWTKDVEKFKSLYEKYFEATSSELYHNPTKGFYSYFLIFPDSETRMEIINQNNVAESDSITYVVMPISQWHWAVRKLLMK